MLDFSQLILCFRFLILGNVDPTERLGNLFKLTLYLHKENQTLLHCAIDKNKGLNHALYNVAVAKDVFGPRKVQRFIQQWNRNGNTILHESAKKGNWSNGHGTKFVSY